MSKRNRSQARGRGAAARQEKRKQALPWSVRLRSMSDLLLHPVSPEERPWKFFAAGACIGLCRTGGYCPVRGFCLAPRRNHAVSGAGAPPSLRQRCNLLGVLLRARSWLVPGLVAGVLKLFDIVGLGQPAWYVGGRQARVLRDLLAHPSEHVLFCPLALWRNRGAGCVADGCFLVRTGWFCPQADDRVCRHGPDFVLARALCAACAGQTAGGFDGGGYWRYWWRRFGCSMPRWP